MKYNVLETSYGPEIRFFDWQVTAGEIVSDHTFRATRGAWNAGGEGVNALFSAGGTMQIYTTRSATVTRSDAIFGSGGDVELSVRFEVERMAPEGSFRIRFHDARRGGGDGGVALSVKPRSVSVFLAGQKVSTESIPEVAGREMKATLVTLADQFMVVLDGRVIFQGRMDYHGQDNEGWTHLDVVDAGIRILEFEEKLITHAVEFREWQRKELLYEETFGRKSWEENWVLNGETPAVSDQDFMFRPMSNVILNRRFKGPIAIDIEATPIPTGEFSAGLTDAIFIWMMDHPSEDLPRFMKNLPDAERGHYLPLPFYWMDFGGTNNVTTRFRRSPGLRMIRQFSDSPRLLERDHTYKVTLVQNEQTVEFWVDDEPWIRAWDPQPLSEGFIGHRSFNSELRVSSLKVWRIE
jgi:hypothetical protein